MEYSFFELLVFIYAAKRADACSIISVYRRTISPWRSKRSHRFHSTRLASFFFSIFIALLHRQPIIFIFHCQVFSFLFSVIDNFSKGFSHFSFYCSLFSFLFGYFVIYNNLRIGRNISLSVTGLRIFMHLRGKHKNTQNTHNKKKYINISKI